MNFEGSAAPLQNAKNARRALSAESKGDMSASAVHIFLPKIADVLPQTPKGEEHHVTGCEI